MRYNGKRLRKGGKRTRCADDCCGPGAFSECLACFEAATSLDLSVSWFGDAPDFDDPNNYPQCDTVVNTCSPSNLNGQYTLTNKTINLLHNTVSFTIDLGGSDNCAQPGTVIWSAVGQQPRFRFGQFQECCAYEYKQCCYRIGVTLHCSESQGPAQITDIVIGFQWQQLVTKWAQDVCRSGCMKIGVGSYLFAIGPAGTSGRLLPPSGPLGCGGTAIPFDVEWFISGVCDNRDPPNTGSVQLNF
jgi:hypothetical protein